jgi:outer membrane protein OmpA-like peptidoglycan-associated protein
MQCKNYLTLCIVLFITASVYSENAPKPQDLKIAADCKDAVKLTITGESKYGPAKAPDGYGKIQEISTRDKNSETAFSEEHNSAWYVLTMRMDGEFQFEVVPLDITNDYDFLLYSYTDTNFCPNLVAGNIKPLRSNISNNAQNKGNGTTGLALNATQQFHRQGQGGTFSAPVQVKKGEKYVLVLDNVTPKGKGHTIYFHNQREISIKGIVLGPDSFPLVADVELADPTGKTIITTTTDAHGVYKIKTAVAEHRNYSLSIINDSSFIGSEIINTSKIKQGDSALPNIKIVLPKLKKGSKYIMGNLNFYGDQAVLIPESYPSVQSLCKLMQRNTKMVIRIEGHVNGGDLHEYHPGYFQELSDDRARAVRDTLLAKGVALTRISTIGHGDRQMLFRHPQSEAEHQANRRVEIKVVTINGD